MTAAHLVLDIKRARSVVCAAAGAGAYGVAQLLNLDAGLYCVLCDANAGLRFTQSGTMRTDGAGSKLEVPLQPLYPLHVFVRGPLSVAAKTTIAVVWFVPLLAVDAVTGKLVAVACEGA